MTAPTDYRQHLEVETPEHVVLDYEIAGLGSRALAAVIDTLILASVILAAVLFSAWAGDAVAALLRPLMTLALFALLWGYFALFEGFNDGQTPGKRWMGIRVIRDTGAPGLLSRSGCTQSVASGRFFATALLVRRPLRGLPSAREAGG